MDVVTAFIDQEFFREIVAKRKRVEYRDITPYWTSRVRGKTPPFLLRLINGMRPDAPEAVVVVERLRRNIRRKVYEFHLGQIREVENWDRRREKPT